MGFMLSGVSLKEKFLNFENLTIENKVEKLVERKGQPNLTLKLLEIQLNHFVILICCQDFDDLVMKNHLVDMNLHYYSML